MDNSIRVDNNIVNHKKDSNMDDIIDENQVLVSINCVVYNHEQYLRQCLDSLIAQKTSFAYEILVHDDASTDRSAYIIREYQHAYPQIIKPIYQNENKYSKGHSISREYQFPRAKGKYIAVCEGDDYWVDPLKIQKQVDFMEKHPFCTACYGKNLIVDAISGEIIGENCCKENDFLTEKECFLHDTFPHTSTALFRKDFLLKAPDFFKTASVGDLVNLHWAGIHGSIYCFSDTFSCYRSNVLGAWTTRYKANPEMAVNHRKRMISFYENFDKYTDYKYHIYIEIRLDMYRLDDLRKDKNLFKLLDNKSFQSRSIKERIVILCETFIPNTLLKYKMIKKSSK